MADKLLQHFEKLNNRNYVHWSFKMKMLMVKENCWKAVSEDAPVPETENWKTMDAKASYFIAFCVDDSQLTIIKNSSLKTAKDQWNALVKQHQKSSFGSKIRIMKKLFKAELKLGGDVEAHLNLMFTWMDELIERGFAIEERMKIAIILSSLNEEYDTLITALEARDEDKMSIEDVKSKILDEGDRRKQKNDSDLTAALKISKDVSTKKNNKKFIKCFSCGKTGHYKSECDKNKEFKSGNSKKGSQHVNMISSSKHVIFHAQQHNIANGWCIDSGATCHISSQLELFSTINTEIKEELTVANGEKLQSAGKGSVVLMLMTGPKSKHEVRIEEVLYVPEAKGNLLSVQKLIERGFRINFHNNQAKIMKGQEVSGIGDLTNGLYILREADGNRVNYARKVNKLCIHQWHRVLAHRHLEDIRKMSGCGIDIKECSCSDDCEPCIMGKMHRTPFPKKSFNPAKEKLDVLVSDVCGPFPVESIGGNKYYVTFTDEYTRYSYVYFMKQKSQVADILIEHMELLKNKFRRKAKIFRSDNGGEYVCTKVQNYLRREGIQIQYTVPYSSFQNGISERRNRTLMDAARSIIFGASLEETYWAEAVSYANFIQNRLINSTTKRIPYESWNDEKPDMTNLHEFGCDAFAWIPNERRKKLDEKARKLKFIGFDDHSKGYRLIDPDSKKVTVARDVRFLESNRTNDNVIVELKSNESHEITIQEENDDIDENAELEEAEVFNNEVPELPGDELQNEEAVSDDESSYYHSDTSVYETDHQDSDDEDYRDETVTELNSGDPVRRTNRGNAGTTTKFNDYLCNVTNEHQKEPTNYKEAVQCSKNDEWKRAMKDEMNSIAKNGTWTLVDLPKNRKAIGSKWVYKIKRDVNGQISRYKARLVAQGFNQKFGTDYDQVFAPVVRQTTFRTLLSVAAKRNYVVKHYDIKTAFLNGELQEEVYMKQPPGFAKGDKVCKLNKGLYGLKQAARSWNKAIHNLLMDNGYKQSKYDKCLYMNDGKEDCYILIFVDDIIIASKSNNEINKIATVIGSKFETKNLGNIKQFLGMEVSRDKEGNYMLSQRNYIDKVVSDCDLSDAKVSKIPIDVGYDKLSCDKMLKDNKLYQKMIGQLLYISTNTRPDIAASVSILSQRSRNPRELDMTEVKRLVRYLKGTRDYKLMLSTNREEQSLIGYTDANWSENRIDRKSNSGHVFMLNGGTISWSCRKQVSVSLSSTEAEYIALSEGCQELVWIKGICSDLKVKCGQTTIHADNQSCIKMVENEKFSNRTKHIDTRYHFIRDMKEKGDIQLEYVPTEDNIADLLTKPLGPKRIDYLRIKINIV